MGHYRLYKCKIVKESTRKTNNKKNCHDSREKNDKAKSSVNRFLQIRLLRRNSVAVSATADSATHSTSPERGAIISVRG